jgi:pimeloyl-ACP methyl ester carboxylesterase
MAEDQPPQVPAFTPTRLLAVSRASDGHSTKRDLGYSIYGSDSPSAPTVFYFHSFPSTHDEGLSLSASAASRGLRLVAISRPGFGASGSLPGRQFVDWPADVLALADHLAVHRFAVLGLSGGGPYVLACVHGIPKERLAGAAVMGGMYPMSLGTAGMMLFPTRLMLWLGPVMPKFLAWVMDMQLGDVARDEAHPERMEKVVNDAFQGRPEPDVKAWRSSAVLRQATYKAVRESMRQGASETVWETKMLAGDWGFDLEKLEVDKGRLIMWHGRLDVNVPVRMAEAAAKLIPNAELRVLDEEAHVSLVPAVADEVFGALKGMLDQ